MKKITLLLSFLPLFIFAQNSGSLNPNYGNSGILGVSKRLSLSIDDATLQGNKLLVLARRNCFAAPGAESVCRVVLRYNEDSTIDETFGNQGIVEINSLAYDVRDGFIETFSDNSFLVTSNLFSPERRTLLLQKYDVDGNLNTSFSGDGELLLDYFEDNIVIYVKPLIPEDSDKVILPIMNITSSTPDAIIHKLESDGSIDDEFGNNGYIYFENRFIRTIDRNSFGSNWFEQIFGGVDGDMYLSMRESNTQTNNYNQYVQNSGVYTDNIDTPLLTEQFSARFFEYDDILTGTSASIAALTLGGNFHLHLDDNIPDVTLNTTKYNTIRGVHRNPGLKSTGDNGFIVFGTDFSVPTDGNFVVSKIELSSNPNGDGLMDDFGANGLVEVDIEGDDRLLDCYSKPNGKIVCIGTSRVESFSKPSMIQVLPNGDFDTNFSESGVYLGDPFFTFNNGVLLTRFPSNQPKWIGTATEPYTGKQRIEEVTINDPFSTSLTGTSFNEVSINGGISYNAYTSNQKDAALVVGSVNNDGNNNFMLYRTSIYGNEFGGLTNEIVQTDINNGSDDRATAAVIQDDNGVKKILVVGESDGNLAMVRYFADGADAGLVDTSFGNNGILARGANQSLTGIPFVPNEIKTTADGFLFMCGEEIIGQEHRFSLKKFDANGAEDITFEAFDALTGFSNVAQDFEMLADGSFLVIGQTGNYETKIRKYNTDGSPDVNFGIDSYLYLNTGTSTSGLNDIIVLGDGRIAVVGYVDDEALVSLFDSNGNLDSGFANSGVLTSSFSFDSVVLTSVEQVDESNILITGNSSLDGNSDLFTAQVLIDNSLNLNEYDSSEFTLYPNPTKDKLTIASNNNTPIDTVEFYDILGKRILTISRNFESIDVSKLALGTYFVKIKAGSSIVSKKLVVN